MMANKPTRQQRIDAVRASIEHHQKDVLEPLERGERITRSSISAEQCALCKLILGGYGGAYKTCRRCPLTAIADTCHLPVHNYSSWEKLKISIDFNRHYDGIEASRAMIASLEKALENELRLQKEEEGK